MSRPGRDDSPDRLYTLTGGRSRSDPGNPFDLVTLVVAEGAPVPREEAADDNRGAREGFGHEFHAPIANRQ